MDNSLVFMLDTAFGGRMEPIVRKNRDGTREAIGQGPRALNFYNEGMFGVDVFDQKRASKHRTYSIEMYGRQGKWTVRFVDGMIDFMLTSAFSMWSALAPNNTRRRGHSYFVSTAVRDMLREAKGRVEDRRARRWNLHRTKKKK